MIDTSILNGQVAIVNSQLYILALHPNLFIKSYIYYVHLIHVTFIFLSVLLIFHKEYSFINIVSFSIHNVSNYFIWHKISNLRKELHGLFLTKGIRKQILASFDFLQEYFLIFRYRSNFLIVYYICYKVMRKKR